MLADRTVHGGILSDGVALQRNGRALLQMLATEKNCDATRPQS